MKPVLLLVDLQHDFLAGSGVQPPAFAVVNRAAALLRASRQNNLPVIHVWTTLHRENDQRLPHWKKADRWWCVAGTSGHQTPVELQPREGEPVIHKTGFNGFASGQLEMVLKKAAAETLILTGIHLHTCVRTVAAEALERGWRVWIADDAVATNDPIFAAATRRWLAERGVEFLSVEQIITRLGADLPAPLRHGSPRDPGKILFEVPVAGAEEIAVATRAAQAAGKIWRQTAWAARLEIFTQVASRLETASPALAQQMAEALGKPRSHGLEEVKRAAVNVRDVVRRATTFVREVSEGTGRIRHEPLGVVALISPWNNPVAIPLGKLAPALIYGNTVVWKPAPAATEISRDLLRLLQSAGVPADAVKLLTGDHTTAQALAANPDVDAVTLTSSAAAGYAIQEICARRFLPLQAELSGNNAAIIWEPADVSAAAAQIVWGAFGFAGQRCTATRRVIVSAAQFELLWSELKIAAEKLVWGDPLELATDIGPVIHRGKCAE